MNKQAFIGRERELQELIQGIESLVQGDFSLSLVTGPPGVGKTYLVAQAEEIFRENSCTFIKTKFLPYSQDLFTPAAEILDEIAKQLLILEPEPFEIVQKTLKEKLRQDIPTIVALSPLSEKVFGAKNLRGPLEDVNEESVVQAMVSYIREAATILFPMILFMDDVQWGDRISMKLIRALCYTGNVSNFYLILACRTSCNDDLDSFISHQKKIQLTPFREEDVKQLLSETYSLKETPNEAVSSLLFHLTHGNPFYVSFLLRKMEEVGAIKVVNGSWNWDIENFSAMKLPEDIKDFMREELEGLPLKEKEIVQLISDFGGTISEEMLELFVPLKSEEGKNAIEKLCDKALLVIHQPSDKKQLALAHDILHEIVYTFQSSREKREKYFRLATILAENGYGETAPDMVGNFLLQANEKKLEDGGQRWVSILGNAGVRSLERSNIKLALKFFRLGESIANKATLSWSPKDQLAFYLAFLKTLYVNEEEGEARVLYQRLIEDHPDRDDQLEIKMAYIYCHAYNGEWEKVLALGKDILSSLGLRLSGSGVIWDLIFTRFLYRRKKVARLLEAPPITDPRILKTLEILVVMFPAANRAEPKLFTQITLKLALLSGKYGDSPYACIGYTSFCYILYFVYKDYSRGNQLQEVTMEILQEPNHESQRSIAYAMLGTFTYHWTHSLRETFQCLQKSIQASDLEGEYLYSNYAFVFSIITIYVMGRPLSSLERYIRLKELRDRRLEDFLTHYMSQVYHRHIESLRSGAMEALHIEGLERSAFEKTINLNANMLKVHELYLRGKYEEAYGLVLELDPQVKQYPGFILNGHYEFFALLVRMAVHSSLESREASNNHQKIMAKIRDLKKWKDRYQPNHGHRYYIAEAEYQYYFEKKSSGAEDLYNQAIEIAKAQNDYQMEGLANMLAARHGFSNEMILRIHGSEAVRLYEKWGATYIAELLRKEFEVWEAADEEDKKSAQISDERAWMDELRNMKENSPEEAHMMFLDYLVSNHYGKNGWLFMEKKGRLLLRYEQKRGQEGVHHRKGVYLNYLENIPHKLIRYVARTEEKVILRKDKGDSPLFGGATWPEKEGEVLCMPLHKMGILAGVLYLEKEGSFDKDILERVEFLYSLILPQEKQRNRDLAHNQQPTEDILTQREVEIITLVGDGLSNSQISSQLFLAEGTVRNHLSRIYEKLQVESRVQAVLVAREKEII